MVGANDRSEAGANPSLIQFERRIPFVSHATPLSLTATRYAWIVVALLMPVALLNYLDRQLLASMKASLMADIPTIANDANWGFMLGQFKWVYAVFSLIGGYVADRFSRRYVICFSLFVWSTITWLTAHTTTYHELLWVRSLMGISEAFYIPAALALIVALPDHARSDCTKWPSILV